MMIFNDLIAVVAAVFFSILPSLLFLFVYAKGDLKMEECLIED